MSHEYRLCFFHCISSVIYIYIQDTVSDGMEILARAVNSCPLGGRCFEITCAKRAYLLLTEEGIPGFLCCERNIMYISLFLVLGS